MPYYVATSLILSSQIFAHLLDVSTLRWLYATEGKCCDELAMHSSLTMALCNRPLDYSLSLSLSYEIGNFSYEIGNFEGIINRVNQTTVFINFMLFILLTVFLHIEKIKLKICFLIPAIIIFIPIMDQNIQNRKKTVH